MDRVERVIAERGWSGRVLRELCEEFGVTPRTVRDYRRKVLDEIAEGYRGVDKEIERSEFLLRVRENLRKASEEGKYGPVASMLNIEGRTLGVYQDGATLTHETQGASLDEVIERLQELPEPVRERLAAVLTGAK
jgi:DNA-binding transcriptional MerR regulator